MTPPCRQYQKINKKLPKSIQLLQFIDHIEKIRNQPLSLFTGDNYYIQIPIGLKKYSDYFEKEKIVQSVVDILFDKLNITSILCCNDEKYVASFRLYNTTHRYTRRYITIFKTHVDSMRWRYSQYSYSIKSLYIKPDQLIALFSDDEIK